MDHHLVYSFEKKHKALKTTIAQVSTVYINKCKEERDDIIQDILVKVWQNWPRYHAIPEKELRWLVYKITRNYIFNKNKQQKTYCKLYNGYGYLKTPHIYHDDLLVEDGLKIYQNALQQLTPAQKLVYSYHQDDFDLDNIAETLQLTEHTVRNHLRAAIIGIKSYLNDNWDLNMGLSGRKRWN